MYSISFKDVGQLRAKKKIRKSRKGSKEQKADRGDHCTWSLTWASLL